MTGPIEDEDWEGLGPSAADRRQRAREAAHDQALGYLSPTVVEAIDEAIAVTIRVKITEDIIEAMRGVTIARGSEQLRKIAEAAFRAAGFEVEK